jgi:hypothetical protein
VWLAAHCAPGADGAAALPAASNVSAVVTNGVALGFPVGEELVYQVYWGFIPVGKTRIVTRWEERDGRRLLAIRYRTRSSKVLAAIYPVDDVTEVLIDPATFLPLKFTANLREGRHHKYEITTFDHARRTARWESLTKNKVKEYPIDPDTRDIVTFMYSMRSRPFRVGDRRHFRVMADEKIYDLYVHALNEEDIRLSGFGSVRSLRLEPTAEFNGLFVRKGRLWVWVSRDARMLCTKVVAEIPVGKIKAVLKSVHGPGDDAWIRSTARQDAQRREQEDSEVERALKELDSAPLS